MAFIFLYSILGIVIPIDFHIFQRGRYTTNQIVCTKLSKQCYETRDAPPLMEFSPEGPKQHPLLSWIRPLARTALGRRQCWACFSDLTAWQTHMGTAHPVCFEKETMETLTTNTPIDSNSQFGRESRERIRFLENCPSVWRFLISEHANHQ